MEKELLYIIHEDDLTEFLEKRDLLEKLEKSNCMICGKKLTLENVGGIYYEKGNIKFVCDSLECISKVERG